MSRSDQISSAAATLGYCPNCAVPVPEELLLIEYERTFGRTCYAECPACRDVIRPAGADARVSRV